jgi:hypothetical protein
MTEVPETGGTWSRIRKLIVVLGIAGLVTWVMLELVAAAHSVGGQEATRAIGVQAASSALIPYVTAMCVLAIVYVSDTLLRDPLKIIAQRFGGGS